jgi:hypothetical protein
MPSDAYRRERQCPVLRADGQPCRGFKLWGRDACGVHLDLGLRLREPKGPRSSRVVVYRTNVPTCRCDAIPGHPHRPGGKPCRWPEGFDDPEAALGQVPGGGVADVHVVSLG